MKFVSTTRSGKAGQALLAALALASLIVSLMNRASITDQNGQIQNIKDRLENTADGRSLDKLAGSIRELANAYREYKK